MIDKRLFMTLLCLLAGHLFGGSTAVAQPVVIDHEYEYKAAYLFHFARLCKWPGEERTPIIIGVLGDRRPFGRQLDRIEKQSEKILRRMKVRVFPDMDAFRARGQACHILFVSGKDARVEQSELMRQVIEATRGQATLIFTENGAFAEQGADVNFDIKNNRLKLLINGARFRLLGNGAAANEDKVEIPPELLNLKSVTMDPPLKPRR